MTIIGDDAVSCYQYNMSVFWNFVDSIKYFIAFVGAPDNTSNVYLSIESLGLVIHKAPLVWDECIRIVFDIQYLDTLFKELGDVRNLELWTHLVENMMYNFADILHNEGIGREALREWIFEESKGACERGDNARDKEIDEDGNGDWKTKADISEKECFAHCREDYKCTAVEYEKDKKECKHWVGLVVGDGETEDRICYLKQKDYHKFGHSLGRILADVVYISPIEEETWSEASSHIVQPSDPDSRSIKVPSSLLQRQVQAGKPMTLFEKYSDIGNMKVKQL
jgi:hypothetical protein